MVRPSNGWSAVRVIWTGAYGMYWLRAPKIPPQSTFTPSTWKPTVPGKTYSGLQSQIVKKKESSRA